MAARKKLTIPKIIIITPFYKLKDLRKFLKFAMTIKNRTKSKFFLMILKINVNLNMKLLI